VAVSRLISGRGLCFAAMSRALVSAAVGAALFAVAATHEISWQVPGASMRHGVDATVAEPLDGLARRLETASDTTIPSQMDTTTPPPHVTMTSILQTMSDAIEIQLRVHKGQVQSFNAAVGLLVGLFVVFNGEAVFKLFVVGSVFLFSMLAALNEVSALWGLRAGDPMRTLVGVEVGAAMAFAAHKGFDGVMMLIAFFFGSFLASGLEHGFGAVLNVAVDSNRPLIVALYTLVVGGTMVTVRHGKHGRILVMFSSIIGGLLVSSSLCYFITLAAANGKMEWIGKVNPNLQPPVPGFWVDFVKLLVHGGKDFGVLVGTGLFGIPSDRIAGCTLWLLVSGIGALFQLKALDRRASSANGKAAARNGALVKPLLENP
jgi:hypothetical protein